MGSIFVEGAIPSVFTCVQWGILEMQEYKHIQYLDWRSQLVLAVVIQIIIIMLIIVIQIIIINLIIIFIIVNIINLSLLLLLLLLLLNTVYLTIFFSLAK